YRHSFLLALALLAASTSHAQSTAPGNTEQIQSYTASSLVKEPRLLSLPAAINLAFDQNKGLAAARKEIEAV
ncbi:hypothetical protein ACP3WD_25340, partial [Salmonella enterica]